MAEPKEKPVCRYCASDDIVADACASWNIDTGDWELSSTYDSVHCNTCEEDGKYADWVTV